MIQVVKTDYARAISTDGINWQIHASCETHQQQWGIHDQPDTQRRYILYGMWTQKNWLYTVPLDPMLDVPDDTIIRQKLIPLLEQHLGDIPFPQQDNYELWLLHAQDKLPVALLSSAIDAHTLHNIHASRWRAQSTSGATFTVRQAQCSTDPLLKIEQLINNSSTSPITGQWFKREKDGSGSGILGLNIDDQLINRTVAAENFPQLLLRSSWPDANMQLLIDEYHQWLAPRLLCLHHIDNTTRELLELAASQQALETSRLHSLYPKIINQKVMNKIMVEARLRTSAQID